MKRIRILLLVFFILSFCFCIYKILDIFKELDEAENLKEELIEIIDIPDVPSEEPEFTINFEELRKINSDVVGWIVIEDTQINYPIVQGSNNSFYLNHSYDKKWSGYGSIFLDSASSKDLSDNNTFIYGHNTQNGSMFGQLYKYMSFDYYKDHSVIYLYTPDANYKADIFSVYIDSTESNSYNQIYFSQEEYEQYIDIIKKKSRYDTQIEVNPSEDKIITLYSCSHESNRKKTDRYFIHAVLNKM